MNNRQLKYISIANGISAPTPNNETDLSKLPKALSRAVQEGWHIAPVSAHSRYASLTRSLLASPSNDASVIARWTAMYPSANYCVRTGRASNLVILEVNHEGGQDSLSDLCNDVWDDWVETLKFGDNYATSFMFRYPNRRLRHLSSEFEGLQVHGEGKLMFLPPCWFVAVAEARLGSTYLQYRDINANVLECPPFLLAADPLPRASGMVIPFASKGVL